MTKILGIALFTIAFVTILHSLGNIPEATSDLRQCISYAVERPNNSPFSDKLLMNLSVYSCMSDRGFKIKDACRELGNARCWEEIQ